MPVITTIFDSAEQFIKQLRPSDARWWNERTGRRTHLFRGHSDAAWRLLPKGWRPLEKNPELAMLMDRIRSRISVPKPGSKFESADANLWRLTLVEAAVQFASLGREIGLEIPWVLPPSVFDQPPREIVPIDQSLLALAQHHGIPTQLLDWSFDPLTAAFFAAADDIDRNTDLCVWALEIGKIDLTERGPTLILVPTAGNTNLRAQAGCFLAYPQDANASILFSFHGSRWPAFETADNLAQALQKLVLPGNMRKDLRAILLREGRSAAHLMPSWDSVAATLLRNWS